VGSFKSSGTPAKSLGSTVGTAVLKSVGPVVGYT